MLGLAALRALAAWMIGKGDGAGLSLALVLGAGRLMIGVTAAFDDHLWFDALFFGITGLLVTVGAGVLWASGRVHPRAASA